ncbi:hypothetical protein AN642_00770 [Epulopiscium sp. SCG-B10WGA-EpuloA2]|nr:hypothetical protein AN642_00770 [Epulopiscium sp. SCG-B10WGA-EpuloA2]
MEKENSKVAIVINSVNTLQKIIDQAPNIIFNSHFIKVDKNTIKTEIDKIEALMPEAFKQANSIIEDKEQILNDAQIKAQNIKEETEREIKKKIESHQIVQEASHYATEIMDVAKQEAIEMQVMGVRHADEKLQRVEYKLKALLNTMHEEVQNFENYLTEVMSIVREERNQIKDTINKITD